MTINSLDWAIIAFILGQIILFVKLVVNLYTRVRVLESELAENKKDDSQSDKAFYEEIEKTKQFCEMKNEKTLIKAKSMAQDLVEEKAVMRINEIAQGLVKAETEINQLKSTVENKRR